MFLRFDYVHLVLAMFCFHSCHSLLAASFGSPAPCNQSLCFTCTMLHMYSSILFTPHGNISSSHAKSVCQACSCLHLPPSACCEFPFVSLKIWLITLPRCFLPVCILGSTLNTTS
ncbi:hypothetical protein ILYODFUR_011266 [Ilyodon furcidens]|uniref:Secreted protein n=1 Tax=Ilyodon furcidens TaxID=33524 RepID=A0ABV0SKN8_9TELE